MPPDLGGILEAPAAFDMRPIFRGAVSPGIGEEASQLYERLKLLEGARAPSAGMRVAPVQFGAAKSKPIGSPRTTPAAAPSIEEALFKNRAQLKVMTSAVAMHLKEAARHWLFETLDELLGPEVWHEDDTLLNPNSFGTYLRLLTYQRGVRPASLGVSNAGNLLAAWVTDDHRLTMEFLASDQVRWALSHGTVETRELAAGQCALKRLAAVLSPYDATDWFAEDAHADHR
jgi:hypothetical protein